MKIAIGADHGGFELKALVGTALTQDGHEVTDLGSYSAESVDYPVIAHAVCQKLEAGEAEFGVLICGSGIGMAITANRHPGIRAAVLHDPAEAAITRQHNDSNVACLGARFSKPGIALEAVRCFLRTPFEGGRHSGRIAQINPAPTTPRDRPSAATDSAALPAES